MTTNDKLRIYTAQDFTEATIRRPTKVSYRCLWHNHTQTWWVCSTGFRYSNPRLLEGNGRLAEDTATWCAEDLADYFRGPFDSPETARLWFAWRQLNVGD